MDDNELLEYNKEILNDIVNDFINKYYKDLFEKKKLEHNKENLEHKLEKLFKNKHYKNIKNIINKIYEDELSEEYVNVIYKNYYYEKTKKHDPDYKSFLWKIKLLSWNILCYYSVNDLIMKDGGCDYNKCILCSDISEDNEDDIVNKMII